MQLDRERRGTDASHSDLPDAQDARPRRRRNASTAAVERRELSLDDASVRLVRAAADDEGDGAAVADDGDGVRFRGYASMFNTRYAVGNPLTWGFYEEVAPGSFTKTLSEGDQRFLIDHDTYYVVSRVSANSLALAQDRTGLAVDSALDQRLSYVSDLIVNLDNRNITGMSIGFYVMKADWSTVEIETVDGETVDADLRTIREIRLLEVSAVTFPACEETEAELNSVASALLQRGDAAAIERRAAYRPELRDLLDAIDREPREGTRGDEDVEPREGTRRHVDQVGLAMRGLAARYALPLSR
jgi:HK97 family phage prohead protease